jgi:hypothetical protein
LIYGTKIGLIDEEANVETVLPFKSILQKNSII